jgi:hypothetical protein
MLVKLKFCIPEIVLGALLTVAIFGMGMMFESSRHPPSQQITASNAANQNKSENITGGIWNWLTHDSTGVFTGFLVVVGGIQIAVFLRQLVLIRRGLKPAEAAAEAAKLNAQAIIDAERAHLFVSIKNSNLERPLQLARMYDNSPTMESGKVDRPHIDYVLNNYGKTVALLRDVKHNLIWEPKGVEMRGFAAQPYRPLETITASKDSKVIPCEFEGDFTFGDTRAIVTGNRALLFFGNAIFIDAFNRVRGVRWECRCSGGNFELIGHYEYEPKD